MIGKKIYKPVISLAEYAEMATWGNENNAIIVDNGEYYELVKNEAEDESTEADTSLPA